MLVEEGVGGDVVWVLLGQGSNASVAEADVADAAAADAAAAAAGTFCLPAPDARMSLTILVTPLADTPRLPKPFTFTAYLNIR
jgi:hypothetical protein